MGLLDPVGQAFSRLGGFAHHTLLTVWSDTLGSLGVPPLVGAVVFAICSLLVVGAVLAQGRDQ